MPFTKLLPSSIDLAQNFTFTGTVAGAGGGITVARSWRQNADTTIAGSGEQFLTANWEALDQTVEGEIGTNLSQSSGIFTFPSTGIYYVTYNLYCNLENDDYHFRNIIHATSNNSSYSLLAHGSSAIQRSSGSYQFSAIAHSLFDVTDTTQCKLKFGYNSALAPNNSKVYGSSTYSETSVVFIRLGDT